MQVERFVFRPGLADKARYYAVVFLNQVRAACVGLGTWLGWEPGSAGLGCEGGKAVSASGSSPPRAWCQTARRKLYPATAAPATTIAFSALRFHHARL